MAPTYREDPFTKVEFSPSIVSEYNWGNFWHLVREVQNAGETVDFYDLRDGAECPEEWALLHQEQALAVTELIDYVLGNSESLLFAARESVLDSLVSIPDGGGEPVVLLQGLVKREEPVLPPRPTNPVGTLTVTTRENIRLKMERARRSVALAESVEPHAEIGVLIIRLTNGERLVLPVEHLQGLGGGMPEQLESYELCGEGSRLRFPNVNGAYWIPACPGRIWRTTLDD